MRGKTKLVRADNGAYIVVVGKTKLGKILAGKEVSGRHSFRVDGDPSRRLYRGKDMAAKAVLAHHQLMKKAKDRSEAIFLAWSQKPTVSNQ